jgi:hypothetical protein
MMSIVWLKQTKRLHITVGKNEVICGSTSNTN